MVTYSIVVPVYNEQENIPGLYHALSPVMGQAKEDTELIFVDDGSVDASLELIRELRVKDPRVKYLSFARNFGHQMAVTAGLSAARGKAMIVMDADLQDPPSLIPALIKKWQDGFKVVYARRLRREKENRLKLILSYVFYRLLNRLTDISIPNDTGDFCLMDRQVVDILNSMPERNRYIRGLRTWVGFRQAEVTFERSARSGGKPKYTFFRSLSLATDGILSLSRAPLRLAMGLGLMSALAAFAMMGLVLYWRLQQPSQQLIGFAIITIAIFFFSAVQLFCMGILGEYVGRIHEEVKRRPLYTVKEKGGFPMLEDP